MVLKINKKSFASSARLFGAAGLGSVLAAMSVDIARNRIALPTVLADFTDNTGGTPTKVKALVIPTAAFDATTAGGANRVAFNTALDKFENVGKVFTNTLNGARARIGLAALVAASGTEVTANTLPAMDGSVATTNGATSLDYADGVAKMVLARNNLSRLIIGANEVYRALGVPAYYDPNVSDLVGSLVTIADANAAATGASAVSKAVADAFLVSLRDSVSALAVSWNAIGGGTIATAALLTVCKDDLVAPVA